MAETLSPTFVGLQFKEVLSKAVSNVVNYFKSLTIICQINYYSYLNEQVADICYSKLNLLLLAMEARKYEGGDIYINPRDKIINPNAIGKLTKCDKIELTTPIFFMEIMFY